MSISERYPRDIPWDIENNSKNSTQKKWILKNNENVYTFNRNILDDDYIFIQKNIKL